MVRLCAASGAGAERAFAGLAHRSRLFEFDEERDGVGRADVVPRMLLRVEPAHLARRNRDVDAVAVMAKSALEGGGGDHHAVGVLVRLSPVAWVIVVAQDTNAVILECHGVELGIGRNGVCHDSSRSIVRRDGSEAYHPGLGAARPLCEHVSSLPSRHSIVLVLPCRFWSAVLIGRTHSNLPARKFRKTEGAAAAAGRAAGSHLSKT